MGIVHWSPLWLIWGGSTCTTRNAKFAKCMKIQHHATSCIAKALRVNFETFISFAQSKGQLESEAGIKLTCLGQGGKVPTRRDSRVSLLMIIQKPKKM